MNPPRWLVLVIGLLPLHFSSAQLHQTDAAPEKSLSSLLADLKDDEKRWNCARAMARLYQQRDSLAKELRAALPALDWQGQLAAIRILCETKSFEPDEDFLRLVVDKLCEGTSLELAAHYSTRHELAAYLIRYGKEHHEKVPAVLTPRIRRGDIESVWLVTHILDKIGALKEWEELFSDELMGYIVSNLADDHIPYNATFAVRICLLLGKKARPYLASVAETGADGQSRRLARFIMGAIEEGSKDALGEIDSLCPLESALLKRGMRPLPEVPCAVLTAVLKKGK